MKRMIDRLPGFALYLGVGCLVAGGTLAQSNVLQTVGQILVWPVVMAMALCMALGPLVLWVGGIVAALFVVFVVLVLVAMIRDKLKEMRS